MTNIIIGGGLAGLAAAYDLARTGQPVTLLESAPTFGGLASSIPLEGVYVERFYHFICRPDHDLMQLIDELGLSQYLHWEPSTTSFYYNGGTYGFGTPFDLLTFKPIPFLQRLRFGLHIVRSQYRKDWSELDKIPARSWLIEQVGREAYYVVWHPLLGVKFGDYHDKISAAWIWHRINRVAASRSSPLSKEYMGYLERGTETVTSALVDYLQNLPHVTMRPAVKVEEIVIEAERVTGVRLGDGEIIAGDNVVSTVAMPILTRLAPGLQGDFRRKVEQIEYIGVVCMLLHLKRPLTGAFWTNINDPEISFNGIIEYSQLNRHLRDQGIHIAYIPYYLRSDDPRYQFSDDYLYEEYAPMIKRVVPDFNDDWVISYQVFRAKYAQAICHTNFVDLVPEHETPVKGLYVTDSTQFYPEDRTISAAIRVGRKVASIILSGQN